MLNYILLQDAASSGWGSMIMIIALIAIFYFFMIAPQQKKQKKINAFRNGLKNGDKVMTAGGIYGRIREIKDDAVILEIADGVRIKIDKNSIYEAMDDITESGAGKK